MDVPQTPKMFGFTGWSGSGKTTLITRVIPLIRARGYRVSTIKHAHGGFDMDRPGKDSWRHREAGADEVLIVTANRWVLLHENETPVDPDPVDLLRHMSGVDLVLVEGFKRHPIPRIEVWRQGRGGPLIAHTDAHVLAVASDVEPAGLRCPILSIDAPDAVADFILQAVGLASLAPGFSAEPAVAGARSEPHSPK